MKTPCRALLAIAFLALGFPSAAQDYFQTDNVEGTWINLNQVPVRPMVLDPAAMEMIALNAHDSTLQVFGGFGPPTHTWRLPWGPRSIALYTTPSVDDAVLPPNKSCVLVACAGDYVLAVVERANGEILAALQLPPEPADLLVDQTANRAFVSCSATDQVVEVDLVTMTIARSYLLPSKHPLFLAFESPGTGSNVIVAPMISGNNSVVDKALRNPAVPGEGRSAEAGPRGILDLENPAVSVNKLPDLDLFRLVRTGSGTVTPVATDVGTILFAHGRNPFDGQGRYWVLNTEANNKDPNKQNEPGVRGDIVVNRASLLTALATGSTPATVVDLDDSNPSLPGRQFDVNTSVGQPWALEFLPTGHALVAGLLTDNVTVLDANGVRQFNWDLDAGAIPRAILFSAQFSALFVYEWGLNKVVAYNMLAAPPTKIFTYDLGFDPAPQIVEEGRALFYDASFSEHNNASCATCHVDGRWDGMAWNLQKPGIDEKGPMITQLLAGLDVRRRFHWRAEQFDLEAFNDAFVNLLGASRKMNTSPPTSPPDEFEKFQAFVFSIQNPSNPFQHRERRLDNAIQPPLRQGMVVTANAVTGRDAFGQGLGFCSGCHALPLSTSNTLSPDNDETPLLKRKQMKVAPFHELYRKEQDADRNTPGIQEIAIQLRDAQGNPEPPRDYPVIGHGLSHAGALSNLHDFVLAFDTLPSQTLADITSFCFQFDQGLAPAAQKCFSLNPLDPNLAQVTNDVSTYLLQQAGLGNCDVVVFGKVDVGRGVEFLAWVLNPISSLFEPEDTTVAPRDLSFFLGQVTAGRSQLFLGLPVGMGERFGIDFDEDDLPNGDELRLGTNRYTIDFDNDGFRDGHEFRNPGGNPVVTGVIPTDTAAPIIQRTEGRFVTGRVARVLVETNEPTKVRVNYSVIGMPGLSSFVESTQFSKHHDLVIEDLLPATIGSGSNPTVLVTYQGSVTAVDLVNNPGAPKDLPPFRWNGQMLGGPHPNLASWFFGTVDQEEIVLDGLQVDASSTDFGFTWTVKATAKKLLGGPPAQAATGFKLIARVFVDGNLDSSFTSSSKLSAVSFLGVPWTPVPGPYLVTPLTDSSGSTSFQFTVPNLQSGQKVRLVFEDAGTQGSGGAGDFAAIRKWNFPETHADFRSHEEEVP